MAVVLVCVVPAPLTIKNHSVSVPPAVQERSAEVAVTLLAVNPVGSAQAGHALTPLTLEGDKEPGPSSTINTELLSKTW